MVPDRQEELIVFFIEMYANFILYPLVISHTYFNIYLSYDTLSQRAMFYVSHTHGAAMASTRFLLEIWTDFRNSWTERWEASPSFFS